MGWGYPIHPSPLPQDKYVLEGSHGDTHDMGLSTREGTPAATAPCPIPGTFPSTGALGLATPQPRDPTVFLCPRTTGSQSPEQSPAARSPPEALWDPSHVAAPNPQQLSPPRDSPTSHPWRRPQVPAGPSSYRLLETTWEAPTWCREGSLWVRSAGAERVPAGCGAAVGEARG